MTQKTYKFLEYIIGTEIFNLKSARATENLSTHFAKHSESYDEQIKNGLRTVFILRIVNYVLPLLGFIGLVFFHLNKGIIDQSFIPIFILFSVAMSLVFHHLKSAMRDLNILKNSKESYEHRAKVGETFVALLASESKDETTNLKWQNKPQLQCFKEFQVVI
jgi:small-conductance mechanosensitive channel